MHTRLAGPQQREGERTDLWFVARRPPSSAHGAPSVHALVTRVAEAPLAAATTWIASARRRRAAARAAEDEARRLAWWRAR